MRGAPQSTRGSARDQKNSPSRFRFRPPLPLTFRLRVQPPDSVSTYLRSVLGAIGNLCDASGSFKSSENATAAICGLFFFQYFHSHLSNLLMRLWKR